MSMGFPKPAMVEETPAAPKAATVSQAPAAPAPANN